jgi:hypothetical protein
MMVFWSVSGKSNDVFPLSAAQRTPAIPSPSGGGLGRGERIAKSTPPALNPRHLFQLTNQKEANTMRPLTNTEHHAVTGGAGAFAPTLAIGALGQWSFIGANLRGIRWEKESEPLFPEPIDDLTIAPSIDHVNILREPIAPTLRAMPPILVAESPAESETIVEYSLSPNAELVIGGGDSGGDSSSGDSGCGGGCS